MLSQKGNISSLEHWSTNSVRKSVEQNNVILKAKKLACETFLLTSAAAEGFVARLLPSH
jgi:hypothetical protein